MIRLSEIYKSVQGEGPRVGAPTIFVRCAGCNMRCPGWPCDTQHAIDPEKYRKEWRNLRVDQVLREIESVSGSHPSVGICLTGGEPFLQTHSDLNRLVGDLVDRGYFVECFSNGSLSMPDWAFASVSFILDWKLPGSGEQSPEQFLTNLHTAHDSMDNDSSVQHVIKFTVVDHADLLEATKRWSTVQDLNLPVYVGGVWGKIGPDSVASWILNQGLPWHLNLQTHKYIWPTDARRT